LYNTWHTLKLKEICEITSSKRIYLSDYQTEGIPFYRGKEIIERQKGYSDVTTELFISIEKFDEIRGKFGVPKVGDLLLTSVGTLGVPYVVKQNDEFYFKDGNLTWFRNLRGIDSKYLYYWILSPLGKAQLKKCTIGSSQPAMTIILLKEMDIVLPSIPTQRKIAAILSAYDDLIENNLRRIKIMEEMAQNLYTEWFVKFRFPGHEKVKIVDSPLGRIPEGWYVRKLNDVLITIESGSRPKGGINTFEREIPSIGAENILGLGEYDYLKDKFVSKDFFNRMTRGHIKDRDVLLYKDGAKIGRKAMFGNGFPHSVCCINEHVFILRVNNQISQSYLYFWLDQPEMTQNIKNLNANSAQPGINQVSVKALPILIPTKEIIVKFDELCEPLLSELFLFAKENNILRKTRDLLLPRLISGELEVSDLDIQTGDDE